MVNFKDLVPKFDSRQIDTSLFFMIFKRQAQRGKFESENCLFLSNFPSSYRRFGVDNERNM